MTARERAVQWRAATPCATETEEETSLTEMVQSAIDEEREACKIPVAKLLGILGGYDDREAWAISDARSAIQRVHEAIAARKGT